MQLTIIIVNYNGGQFLTDCLDSVLSQHSFFNEFNTIVFDNASTDDSLDVIRKYKDKIKLIEHDTNNQCNKYKIISISFNIKLKE